jgi:hypothetical protein
MLVGPTKHVIDAGPETFLKRKQTPLLTTPGPQSSFDQWTIILVAPECRDMAGYARIDRGTWLL